jgi:hypothetical protein
MATRNAVDFLPEYEILSFSKNRLREARQNGEVDFEEIVSLIPSDGLVVLVEDPEAEKERLENALDRESNSGNSVVRVCKALEINSGTPSDFTGDLLPRLKQAGALASEAHKAIAVRFPGFWAVVSSFEDELRLELYPNSSTELNQFAHWAAAIAQEWEDEFDVNYGEGIWREDSFSVYFGKGQIQVFPGDTAETIIALIEAIPAVEQIFPKRQAEMVEVTERFLANLRNLSPDRAAVPDIKLAFNYYEAVGLEATYGKYKIQVTLVEDEDVEDEDEE